jgi:mRNA interferase RelE/StbE
MPYQIIIERTARKEIQKINHADQALIIEAIQNLSNEPRPHGCKKLKGREAWRIRVGDYRVIYEIQDNLLVITVIHAGHRRDIYKM